MDPSLALAARYGYQLLVAAVLLAQVGLPLPAGTLLLAAGAVSRAGAASAPLCVGLAVLASSVAHLAWFEAGRRRGAAVLRVVCRISLEPDTCVRRTENLFTRYGAKLLLGAPFIPGLGMVAPPLAGLSGMARGRYLLIDALGSLTWAGAYVAAGYLLGPQLARGLVLLKQVGGSAGSGALLLFAGWIAWKVLERRRVLRNLRTARITPQELKRRMDAGEELFLVDLRHPLELEADPRSLPGALRLGLDELEARHAEIPRDREVAIFCS